MGPDWVRRWPTEIINYGQGNHNPVKTWQALLEAHAGGMVEEHFPKKEVGMVGCAALVMMVGAKQLEAPP